MKTSSAIFFLFFLTVNIAAQPTAKTEFGAEMASILDNMKAYTLEIIQQMPEDQFDYKPTEEVRTFREQIEHMALVLDFQTQYVLQGNNFGGDEKVLREAFGKIKERNSGKSREDLLKQLATNFDAAATLMTTMTKKDLKQTYSFFFFPDQPVKTLQTVAMTLRDHITHHRGQLIVYLRMNGIEPVRYQLF